MGDKPIRIQRRRTKGWKMPENTEVVDRTSIFGNPFPVTKGSSTCASVAKPIWSVGTWSGPALWFRDSKDEAVQLAVDAYREWINQPRQSELRNRARTSLRGKNLACWCALDQLCHADVLLEIANAPEVGS